MYHLYKVGKSTLLLLVKWLIILTPKFNFYYLFHLSSLWWWWQMLYLLIQKLLNVLSVASRKILLLLYIHCQSADDDLKIHTLKLDDQFEFDVFYHRKSSCHLTSYIRIDKNLFCTWLVKELGIYFSRSKDPSFSDFQLIHLWSKH